MKWIAWMRCLLCNDLFEGRMSYTYPRELMLNGLYAASQILRNDYRAYRPHSCKNGGCGIGILAGFKLAASMESDR
jgi:hypothetical protein